MSLLDQLNDNKLDIHDFDMKNELTNRLIPQMTFQNLIHDDPAIYLINHYIIQHYSPYMDDIQLNNHIYTLQPLLSYLTIGLLLQSISIHFLPLIASMILKNQNQKIFYTILNKFNPLSFNQVFNNLDKNNLDLIKWMLFQTSHALLTGQQVYKLTHYQCHHHNLLYRQWPEEWQTISYPIPNYKNIVISKENYPFLIFLKDYSFARINNNYFTVIPNKPIYKEFSPWYDFATLLGSLLLDEKKVFKNKMNYTFILKLILWFFYDSIDITGYNKKQLNDMKDYILYRYYETTYKKNKIMTSDRTLFGNKTKTMVEVVQHLGQMLTSCQITKDTLILPDLSPYDLNNVFIETDTSLSICPQKNIFVSGYSTWSSQYQTINFKTLKNVGPGCHLDRHLSPALIQFMQDCTTYYCTLIPFDQYVVWRYTIGSATINQYLILNQLGENTKYWCHLFLLYFKNTFHNKAGVPLIFQKYQHYFDHPELFNQQVTTQELQDIVFLYSQRLQNIIQNAPKPKEDIAVYKVSCYYPELPDYNDFHPKKIVQQPFNSTTINPHLNFATFIDQQQLQVDIGCCFFQIIIPKGFSCLYIPKEFHAYPFENEILLPHHITFDIKNVSTKNFHFINVDTINLVDLQKNKQSVTMGPVFDIDLYEPCVGPCQIHNQPFYVYQTLLK
jgi:hypothetical protein